MKLRAMLYTLPLIMTSLLFSASANAVVGWVSEIHNTTGDEFYIHTSNKTNIHKGEVKPGSIHCGKKVTEKYSNWKTGNYRVCNNDQLFLSKMGIPWYEGGGHYLTIWNSTKHGKNEPIEDSKKLRIFIGGCGDGKDCLRFQVAGKNLHKKKEAIIGNQGALEVIEFSMIFNKREGLHFTAQSENSGTVKAIKALGEFVWENREEIAKVLGIAVGTAAKAAAGGG